MVIKINYTSSDVYVSTSVSPVYVVVNYSAVNNGGGGAVWGGITGTLSDQTDLQDALDDKVPYTGATANVNLGEYELKAGQMTLDTSPTGTAAVGTTRWNDTIGSSETTLKGGSVILKNGVDLVARVVNKVSPNTTLTKAAYQAVRVSGAQGQRLAVALAQANNDANSADTIGLVTETIATNQEGFIMTVGQLENINTTGSLQGETWADGDVLYLSPTTAGVITKVKPTGNGHIVVIGYVEYAHANNGKIYVKVMNGWELDELHDVSIVSPANNEALIYESATSLWKNKTIASALGYTPISGSGTSGQIAYWNGTSSQTGSNNLFWDAANSRLGIGTNAPTRVLDILRNNNSLESVRIKNSSNGINATTGFIAANEIDEYGGFTVASSQFSNVTYRNNTNLFASKGLVFLSDASVSGSGTSRILFITGGFNNGSTLAITAGNPGNILMGTTTDGGQRLQVMGDAFIKGSGATSATIGLQIQNNSSVNLLRVRNDGRYLIGGNANAPYIQTSLNGNPDNTGGNLYFYNFTNAASSGVWTFGGDGSSVTSGFTSGINLDYGFTPLSGTAIFNAFHITSRVNQQFGANGVSRGIFIAPTLTSAADWRSIEWSNNSGWGLYGAGTANNYLNGRLGIGNTNPTYILDILVNANNAQLASFKNSSAGIDAFGGFVATNNNNQTGGFAVYSSAFSNTIFANNLALVHNRSIVIGTDSNVASGGTSKISFQTGGYSVTPQMTLTAAGRLLLGTTTESTFLLDVNGTARVSGDLTLATSAAKINGSTSGNILVISNPAGTRSVVINQNGGILLDREYVSAPYFLTGSTQYRDLSMTSLGSSGLVLYDGGTGDMALKSGQNRNLILDAGQGIGGNRAVVLTSTYPVVGTSYPAKLVIESTTQGFLPSRMTTTQKTSIASPVAGLIVYDTTLNKLCVHNGTTWETITSL